MTLVPRVAPSVAAGGDETIGMTGHWVVEVRDADGTSVLRREFHNALAPTNLLPDFLSGQLTAGPLLMRLSCEGAGCPAPCLLGLCLIIESRTTFTASASVFKNLTTTSDRRERWPAGPGHGHDHLGDRWACANVAGERAAALESADEESVMSIQRGPIVTVVLIMAASILVPAAAPGAGPEAPAKQSRPAPPPRAGVPPAVVTVTESIAVGDTPAALPPVVIDIRESLGVSDRPGGDKPPATPPPKTPGGK
jgi:hypothetical protein